MRCWASIYNGSTNRCKAQVYEESFCDSVNMEIDQLVERGVLESVTFLHFANSVRFILLLGLYYSYIVEYNILSL